MRLIPLGSSLTTHGAMIALQPFTGTSRVCSRVGFTAASQLVRSWSSCDSVRVEKRALSRMQSICQLVQARDEGSARTRRRIPASGVGGFASSHDGQTGEVESYLRAAEVESGERARAQRRRLRSDLTLVWGGPPARVRDDVQPNLGGLVGCERSYTSH